MYSTYTWQCWREDLQERSDCTIMQCGVYTGLSSPQSQLLQTSHSQSSVNWLSSSRLHNDILGIENKVKHHDRTLIRHHNHTVADYDRCETGGGAGSPGAGPAPAGCGGGRTEPRCVPRPQSRLLQTTADLQVRVKYQWKLSFTKHKSYSATHLAEYIVVGVRVFHQRFNITSSMIENGKTWQLFIF